MIQHLCRQIIKNFVVLQRHILQHLRSQRSGSFIISGGASTTLFTTCPSQLTPKPGIMSFQRSVAIRTVLCGKWLVGPHGHPRVKCPLPLPSLCTLKSCSHIFCWRILSKPNLASYKLKRISWMGWGHTGHTLLVCFSDCTHGGDVNGDGFRNLRLQRRWVRHCVPVAHQPSPFMETRTTPSMCSRATIRWDEFEWCFKATSWTDILKPLCFCIRSIEWRQTVYK